ncbi:MAG: 50S ribosomal protein L9 [Rickettsiales bacterium]|nr:50S ribosomal protein L9 [Rickettsiales bacterium]
MKIILISTISNLGKIGDVVEVKNGYAKNFLIPNKKAICFTANSYKIFESRKQEFEQENQKNLEGAAKVKQSINGKDVVIIKNASDDGRLYGSVSSADIAAKVNEIIGAKNVSRADIFLKKPIKEIGVYQVRLAPHSEVSFEVRLIVTRSESEIEALLAAERKGNKSADKSSDVLGEEVAAEESIAKVEKPKKARVKKSEDVTESA